MHGRIIIIPAAALLLLSVASACAKLGTVRESLPDRLLSYEVMRDRPLTRADYDSSVPFFSYAWLLPEGKSWDTDKSDAQLHIDRLRVSFHPEDGRWYGETDRYWPKSGSLTFFACSPASIPEAQLSIDRERGVVLSGWNVAANPDTDFMVAETVPDRKAPVQTSAYSGVPVVFSHKLSLVSFRANVEVPDPADVIRIRRLSLHNIYAQGSYGIHNRDLWGDRDDLREFVLYSDEAGMALGDDYSPIGDSVLMIPQNLSATSADPLNHAAGRDRPFFRLVYSDADGVYSDDYFFTEHMNSFQWLKGQRILYTVSFGSGRDPILFDGSAEDWEEAL